MYTRKTYFIIVKKSKQIKTMKNRNMNNKKKYSNKRNLGVLYKSSNRFSITFYKSILYLY